MAQPSKSFFPLYMTAASGAVLSCLSIIVFFQETKIFGRPTEDAAKFSTFLSQSDNDFAISEYSKAKVMGDCWLGLNASSNTPVVNGGRLAVAKRCLQLADEVLADMPVNGAAWLVKAESSLILGDVTAFRDSYRMSQRVSAHEGAIAQARFKLAEDNVTFLDDKSLTTHFEDIAMLAASPAGSNFLAGWYIANPDNRDNVVKVLEGLPGAQQQQFLYRLRNTTAGSNP